MSATAAPAVPFTAPPTIVSAAPLRQLGIRAYGVAAMALGIVAMIWRDFATVWHPVPAGIPYRTGLVFLVAILFLAAGVAAQSGRLARPALVLLAVLYALAACLWLPRVVGYPGMIGTWLGFAEQLALSVAAVAVLAVAAPRDATWARRGAQVGRALFGLCFVVFGLAHFLALKETAGMVPAWLPPGQRFWALVTGAAHALAGIAIIANVRARLAAQLLTVMLAIFGALVWAPSAFANPHDHIVWAGNAINLAMVGAAWMIADSLGARR